MTTTGRDRAQLDAASGASRMYMMYTDRFAEPDVAH